jgi:hypothetical protein
VIFLLAQPLFYWFIFSIYILNHPDIRNTKERFKKLAVGPLYALLQQLKLLTAVDLVYLKFEDSF